MKPQDAKPQEANLRLTDKCEEQTRGQWDSEAEFLLGEELRQSPCGEKDPDVQGSTESKDQCGGIWAEKNRDGSHLDGASWVMPRRFYFLLSAVGSHSRAESRQVVRS